MTSNETLKPAQKVVLVRSTPQPDLLTLTAALTCSSRGDPLKDALRKEESVKWLIIRQAIDHGHLSILEHVSFTFLLTGMTRVAQQQLTRSRLASYSIQSFRRPLSGDDDVTLCHLPDDCIKNEEERVVVEETLQKVSDLYRDMMARGVSADHARYILPMGLPGNVLVTMNARELRTFLADRLCSRASDEIREYAREMLKAAQACAPYTMEGAGAKCEARAFCPEGVNCRHWVNGSVGGDNES